MFTLEYSEIFMLMHPSLDKNQVLLPLFVTIDHAKNKNKNSFQSIRNVLKPSTTKECLSNHRSSINNDLGFSIISRDFKGTRNRKHWKTLETRKEIRDDAQRRSLEKSSPPSPSSRCSCRSHAFEKRSFFHYEEKRAGEDRKK